MPALVSDSLPTSSTKVSFLTHQLDKLLRAQLRALVVVGHNLSESNAGSIDLAIDQERGNSGFFRLLDRGDGCVRAGVVKNDRFRAARDRGVDQLRLLIGIIVVNERDDVVAKFLRFRLARPPLPL